MKRPPSLLLVILLMCLPLACSFGCPIDWLYDKNDQRVEPEAQKGNAHAQYLLALRYLENSPKDKEADVEAVKWLTLASDAGHSQAQKRLADMYREGRGGLSKDINIALDLYKKAALNDDFNAQEILISIYTHGSDGIAPDKTEAAKWVEVNKESKKKFSTPWPAPKGFPSS